MHLNLCTVLYNLCLNKKGLQEKKRFSTRKDGEESLVLGKAAGRCKTSWLVLYLVRSATPPWSRAKRKEVVKEQRTAMRRGLPAFLWAAAAAPPPAGPGPGSHPPLVHSSAPEAMATCRACASRSRESSISWEALRGFSSSASLLISSTSGTMWSNRMRPRRP